jgi:macrolide-specific efflux system membrane fusion protein
MVATASFAESAITGLAVGQSATVLVTGPSVTVPGALTQIVPVASSSGSSGGTGSSVATYAVTVTLTDPPATVLSGMSATVTVTTDSVANALRVPATALSGSATTGYTVEVVNANGGTSSVAVQVGVVTTSYVQITSGLSEGDTVVVGTTTTRNSTTTTTTTGGVSLGGLTGGGGFTGGAGGFGGR